MYYSKLSYPKLHEAGATTPKLNETQLEQVIAVLIPTRQS